MNKLSIFIAAILMVAGFSLSAQVAITTDGSSANGSAMLDVQSTSKGALVPRMTSGQRGAIVSPVTGLLVFQTDAPEGFYYYNAASAWVYLTNSAGVLAIVNGGTGSSTQNFVDLSTDQTVAGNKSLSGNTSVGGTLAVTGVATLTAAPVLTSATASQALFTDATKNVVCNPITGTGSVVMSTSPTLVTPTLGVASATSINGLTPTSQTTGFTIAGGTTSKTLTVPSDASVSGTNTGDQTNVTGSAASFSGSLAGDVTGLQGTTVVEKINGTSMAGLATGILMNTTTTGVPSIAVAADFPPLNQNTTGTAANVTGTVAIANGGTGSETQNFVDLTTIQTVAGNKTFSGDVTAKRYVLTQPSAIASAATTTIDLSTGNVFQVNLGANITTLTLTNPAVGTYLVKFTQDATGTRTVAFPAAWKWSGGTAPIVTVTAAKTDIVTLIYDGTTYYAAIVQNF